ncbi:hypothetical protein ABB07_00455 [Streptomyces incarnatus]|uniref:Uncharacterized protein n=1 Tax=Streptomyces incarnatus TaxID=665007 RepID=A0ABM5TCR6_9ACTN|nr:hypothetical protein ABB07_00455 [Streptomyces incarnatus]
MQVTFGVGLGEQSGEDLLPGAVGCPLPQPVVDAFPRAEVLGQVFDSGMVCLIRRLRRYRRL